MRKLLASIALVFIFLSCDNGNVDTDANPFVGTWERVDRDDVRFVFTKTIATGYINNGWTNNEIYWTGAYTYDDTHITVILDEKLTVEGMIESWSNGLVYNYEFNDGLLLLRNPALTTFKKVTDS